jgi:hypothetical protein
VTCGAWRGVAWVGRVAWDWWNRQQRRDCTRGTLPAIAAMVGYQVPVSVSPPRHDLHLGHGHGLGGPFEEALLDLMDDPAAMGEEPRGQQTRGGMALGGRRVSRGLVGFMEPRSRGVMSRSTDALSGRAVKTTRPR